MSLLKAASTVSLLTLASRITGLARDLLMAAVFGANIFTDAFNVAFRIPNLFRRLFAEGAFSQAFVPVLAAHRERHGVADTRRLIDAVGTALLCALVLTSVAGMLGAPLLVWALASGLRQDPAGFDAAIFMTRWMFPYIGFMSLVAFAAGILNTWKRFAVPAVTPVLLNLCMIAAAWWGAPWLAARGVQPIFAMVGGVMGGGLLQLVVQLAALRRLRLLPRMHLLPARILAAWRDPGVRRILSLMAPAVLGVGVAQLSLMINTQIASYLAPGSVTWLFYADRLMEFPTALLGVALGVVLAPQLSGALARGDGEQYSAMLDWGLRMVVLLAVPCAVGLLVLARPLVATLFHYGALTDADVLHIATALMGYGVGLVGLVAVKVLAPGYYASQDMRTPVRIAIVVLVVTQLLNALLVPWMAHAGLALSIALGALVNAVWLLFGLRRSGRYRPRPGWPALLARVALAAAALALLLAWSATQFDWIALRARPLHRVGLLAAVLLGSAMAYFGVLAASGLKWAQFARR
ncbi:murein biosynthesis integral membrane protein MurJ [Comamonas flocculans]|uniref:Probable lipid II flippase MurJ n=1 Tax=Comamonas flocculans TaxID=2597701 RepID=A0A5B8RZU7_9BURK|nr:murein biosynthesis integral membrane protein MurJ [Comamonas flocculans]QEA14398.1 murein biosynthesis integral membrane protein MurJ [Comamonas flocculans]